MDIGKLIGLDKLDNIIEKLERRSIKIYSDQCLTVRDKQIECQVCAQECPVDAVDLGEAIDIDFKECVDCGICVNVCPVGVFESRLNEDFFLSRIQTALKNSEMIRFSCSKQIADAGGKLDLDVEVPCLGRISETMIIGGAVLGAERIWLNTALCLECELQGGAILAGETIKAVDKLLEAWGRPVEFSLTSDRPNQKEVDESTGADEEGYYNRRELLTKFQRESMAVGLGLAQERIDKYADLFNPPEKEHLSYRLPRKRELLLQLTKKLGAPLGDSVVCDELSFYGLTIEAEKCNLCGHCALLCPTKALEVNKDENSARIDFSISRCLGCDFCLKTCTPGALAINPRVSLPDVFSEKKSALVELDYFKCDKCKQVFASAKKRDLCFFCQLREDKLQDDSWS